MNSILLLCAATLPLALTTPNAKADGFSWSKFGVRTDSEMACMQFASNVARSHGLHNLREIPYEVSGERQGAHIAMTCIDRGPGQNAVAVVMVMSPSGDIGNALRDEMSNAISNSACFVPC
ncbi:hypothetical protein [Paraburkholderia terrae]